MTETATPTKVGDGGAKSASRSPSGLPAPVAPVTAERRRRPALLGLGVALIVIFGLAGWWLASSGAQTQTVLVASGDIEAGKPVATRQLGTTEISGGTNASTIPAEQLEGTSGLLASSNIPAGAVLSPDMFVNKVTPDSDSSIVGVPAKPTQMPALGLKPGDAVTVIVTSSPQGSGDDEAPGAKVGETWRAEVSSVGDRADDGTRTVDVTLETKAAQSLAAAGGTGRLAIILDPSAR